jgi:hypothetical protein
MTGSFTGKFGSKPSGADQPNREEVPANQALPGLRNSPKIERGIFGTCRGERRDGHRGGWSEAFDGLKSLLQKTAKEHIA